MRASHLRSDLSRVLIDIEAGTRIYGRSSSSVRALRVGMNVEDHGHWARYVRSGICRAGHRRSGASHNLSSRARRFGRHYGRSSSALRDPGIRFAASTCLSACTRFDRIEHAAPFLLVRRHAVGRSPVRSLVRGTLDRNLKVTKVHIYRPCGSSSSPVLAMATGLMAEAHRHYE